MIQLSSGLVTALPSPALLVVGFHVWTPRFCDDSLVARAASPCQSYLNLLIPKGEGLGANCVRLSYPIKNHLIQSEIELFSKRLIQLASEHD
jgi:hypothetical protein